MELRPLNSTWLSAVSAGAQFVSKRKTEAYTPQLISIGPLHRGDERLKGMKSKIEIFQEFAERDGMDRMKIEDLVMCIQDKEAYIRAVIQRTSTKLQAVIS
uniref:Uncharacterized protein n=1 Tax=Salix viminalis TaxID=40686 RepID=A0A6N2MXE1_SALVM